MADQGMNLTSTAGQSDKKCCMDNRPSNSQIVKHIARINEQNAMLLGLTLPQPFSCSGCHTPVGAHNNVEPCNTQMHPGDRQQETKPEHSMTLEGIRRSTSIFGVTLSQGGLGNIRMSMEGMKPMERFLAETDGPRHYDASQASNTYGRKSSSSQVVDRSTWNGNM